MSCWIEPVKQRRRARRRVCGHDRVQL